MYKIVSFNGISINDGVNYSAEFNGPSFLGSTDASPTYIKQTNADSVASGVYTVGQKSISITIGVVASIGRGTLVNQLRYNLQRGGYGKLVVTFLDDNTNYYVNASITSLQPTSIYDGYYIVTMTTGDTDWRAVTASTDTWSIALGNEATKTITIDGTDVTRLIMSITPTSNPAVGYLYQNYYNVINIPSKSFANIPICITLDTNALIHASPTSKMQSLCQDLRILVDGNYVNRWITGADTATTKIWFNMSLAAGGTMTLLTEVPLTGSVTQLVFKNTAANLAAYSAIQNTGYMYHGGECFSYSGKTKNASGYIYLNNVVRAYLGTTQIKHVTNSSFNFIQHTVAMVYGNNAVDDPSTGDDDYDNLKPVFNLTTSVNGAWSYDATTPYYAPGRPGSWVPSISKPTGNAESEYYTIKQNADTGDYALGMKMACYIKQGKWQPGDSTIAWELSHPAGIYSIAATGEKYKNTTRWPSTSTANNTGLVGLLITGAWYSVWNESTPSALSWTSFTRATATVNRTRARFIFMGSMPATTNAYACLEILTCTVTFIASYVPTATALGEKANYTMDITIENTTNGDSVRVVYPMLLTVPINLNCENYTITYHGTSVYNAMIVDDTWRDVWIRLVPGANVIKVSGPNGFGDMTADLSWYKRRV